MEPVGDHGGGKVMRARDHVGDDFRILGVRDTGFEDADDGARAIAHRSAAEPDRFANDRRIFRKTGRPEAIRENHDAGSLGTIVLRPDEMAEDRMQAHDFEVVAANDAGLNDSGLPQADHGEFDG